MIRLRARYSTRRTRQAEDSSGGDLEGFEPHPWASDERGRPSLGASPISTSLQGTKGPFFFFTISLGAELDDSAVFSEVRIILCLFIWEPPVHAALDA